MNAKNLIRSRSANCSVGRKKMGADVGYSPRVIACPSCPKCGTRMLLVRIFPDSPGHDQRTYECPRCEHEVTEIFQLERRATESA
jgi:DNA-directed RNA polymerase subunit RPC12/RpoP